MAAQNKNTTRIIDLKIKGAEALKTIEQLNNELEAQKKVLQDLAEKQKENKKLTAEENQEKQLAIATSKQLQKELTAQNKVLQNNVAENRAMTGSLKEMRAQYNTLKTAYENLSDVQREALIPQMKELKDKIEEADRAVGNYSSSVGGYEQAISNALPGFGKFQQMLSGIGITADTSAKVMAKNVVTALKSVGQTMTGLMSNPLIAGIAGILAVILLIKEAIGKNQAAMDGLQKVFAPFKMIVDAFFRGLGEIIGVIVEGISKFIEFIIPANSALKDSIAAEKELQALRKDDIKDIEWIAKSNLKIADLRDKLLQKEKYSAEQRIKFTKEIQKELEKQMKDEIEDANRELRAFELRNSIAIKNKTLTDEEKKEWATLRSKIDEVKTSILERGRAATKASNAAIAEINNEKEEAAKAEKEKQKAYAETAKRRKDLQKSINQQLEDLANSLISSEREREIAEAEAKYNRSVQDIKIRLKTDTDLTAQARKDLNAILLLMDDRYRQDVAIINKKYSDDEFNKLVEQHAKELEMKRELDAGTADYEAKRVLDEAALKLEKRRQQLNDEFLLEQEQAAKEHEMLLNLDEAAKDKMFLTQEAYELAVLQSNKRVEKSNSDLRRAEIEKAQQLLTGVASIAGGLSDLFGAMAGESKAMQEFQKALGIVQILGNMAVGIAEAIKAGAGLPFPANLPAIASGIATVTTGITSALNLLKNTQTPQIPSQLSSGASGSSVATPATPSIPAPTYTTTTLNLGNADTGSRVSSVNQANEIKAAIKEAYQEVPAPVVKVSDIQRVTAISDSIKNISLI